MMKKASMKVTKPETGPHDSVSDRYVVCFPPPQPSWPVLSRAIAFHTFQVHAWSRWLKCRNGHKSRPRGFQISYSRLSDAGLSIAVTEQSSTGGNSVCYTRFLLPSLETAMQGNAKIADVSLWIVKGWWEVSQSKGDQAKTFCTVWPRPNSYQASTHEHRDTISAPNCGVTFSAIVYGEDVQSSGLQIGRIDPNQKTFQDSLPIRIVIYARGRGNGSISRRFALHPEVM